MAENQDTTRSNLNDEVTNFIGEVAAVTDLMIGAADNPAYEIDRSMFLAVATSFYFKASDLQKRLRDEVKS